MEKIIWVDLETTGVDYEKDSILEVAVVVTDYELYIQDTYHSTIRPPDGYTINDWARQTHTNNYLLAGIDEAPEIERVDLELALWSIEAIAEKNKYPMAGNSIYFDKRFAEAKLPRFSQYLGKSVIDISGMSKLLHNLGWIDKSDIEKTYRHRAMTDILESIDELRYYLHKLR